VCRRGVCVWSELHVQGDAVMDVPLCRCSSTVEGEGTVTGVTLEVCMSTSTATGSQMRHARIMRLVLTL